MWKEQQLCAAHFVSNFISNRWYSHFVCWLKYLAHFIKIDGEQIYPQVSTVKSMLSKRFPMKFKKFTALKRKCKPFRHLKAFLSSISSLCHLVIYNIVSWHWNPLFGRLLMDCRNSVCFERHNLNGTQIIIAESHFPPLILIASFLLLPLLGDLFVDSWVARHSNWLAVERNN